MCQLGCNIVRDESYAVGDLHFFAVYMVVKVRRDEKLWAICRCFEQVEKDERKEFSVGREGIFLVELGSGVRRAGATHICSSGCKAPPGSTTVSHSQSVLDGGRYELWSREDGYPPYMG